MVKKKTKPTRGGRFSFISVVLRPVSLRKNWLSSANVTQQKCFSEARWNLQKSIVIQRQVSKRAIMQISFGRAGGISPNTIADAG